LVIGAGLVVSHQLLAQAGEAQPAMAAAVLLGLVIVLFLVSPRPAELTALLQALANLRARGLLGRLRGRDPPPGDDLFGPPPSRR
jgi:hypothetical protein